MPSDLDGYFGNKILRWLNNQADMPSRPTGLWIALFNGNPKTSGSEVGATINPGTPRQPVTFGSLASGVNHILTSNVAVDFGNADAETPVSHIALYDNATPGSGNRYASKAVNGGPVTIADNSSVIFASGEIQFNIGSDT